MHAMTACYTTGTQFSEGVWIASRTAVMAELARYGATHSHAELLLVQAEGFKLVTIQGDTIVC